MQERLERVPLMAIIESLTKTPPGTILNPFYDTSLKPELNSTQLWDQSSQLMLAQVVYLPDKHMQYQCHLYLSGSNCPEFLCKRFLFKDAKLSDVPSGLHSGL